MYANPFSPMQGFRVPRSSRNVRGNGWHKKGYRDRGCMWINVRRGSYGHVRGTDVNEDLTIKEMWLQIVRTVQMEEGFPIPSNWTFGLSCNKQVIVPSDEPVTTIFDGGENVYVKVYDENDDERVYDFGTEVWDYHVPGRRY